MGVMVAAVVKIYLIGTALTVLAVFYGIVDSFGGMMYVQNNRYFLELHQENQGKLTQISPDNNSLKGKE